MGKIQFLMNTNGHCFLCLKLATSTIQFNNYANEENVVWNEPPEVVQIDPKIYSFRNICQYLKIDIKEVSNEAMPISSSSSTSTAVLENSELKGVLCGSCSLHFDRFSKNLLELEEVKMKLRFSLTSIYDILVATDRNDEMDPVEFEREMLMRQQTSLRSEFVEQLRRKTLERCSTMIGKGGPFVKLKKAETPGEELPPPNKPTGETKENELPENNEVPESEVCLGTLPSILEVFLEAKETNTAPPIHASLEATVNSVESGQENLQITETASNVILVSRRVRVGGKCDICQKSFKWMSSLKRHRKSAHFREGGQSQGKQFKCRFCSTLFRSSFVRNRHIKMHCSAKFPKNRDKLLSNSSNRPKNGLTAKSSPDKSNLFECFICRKVHPLQSIEGLQPAERHGNMPLCQNCHERFELRSVKGRRNETGQDIPIDQPIYVVQRKKKYVAAAENPDGTVEPRSVQAETSTAQRKPKVNRKRNKFANENAPENSEADLLTPMQKLMAIKMEGRETEDEEIVEVVEGGNSDPTIEITAENKFLKRCKFCSKKFTSKLTMRQHLIHFHRAKYSCEFCEKVFKHDLSLFIHQQSVHFRRKLPIPEEDDDENDEVEDEEPDEFETSNDEEMPELEIEVCPPSWEELENTDLPEDVGQMSPFLESLGLHRKKPFRAGSKHSIKLENDSNEIGVECDVCQEKVTNIGSHKCTYFETTLKLNENGEVVGEETIPKLPQMTIINPKSPVKKVESILNQKTGRHKCRKCSKEFPRESAFHNHFKSVHLQVRYKCDLCGRDYPYRSEYTRHHRDAHIGVRFKCDLCTKPFATKSNLLEHRQNVHFQEGRDESEADDNDRPNSSSKILKVKKRQHRNLNDKFKMDIRLKCDICNKFCTTLSNLHKHKRRAHVGQILKCQNCLKIFSSVSNRNQHVRLKRCIKTKSGKRQANI